MASPASHRWNQRDLVPRLDRITGGGIAAVHGQAERRVVRGQLRKAVANGGEELGGGAGGRERQLDLAASDNVSGPPERSGS